jgi:hypothetical protein
MPFIPATKLAPGGKVAGFVESIGTAFPRAKAVYEQQAGQATKDFQEAALRKAYPQVADQVAMKLRTQGYKEAVNFGNQATASLRGPMKNFTKPSRTYVTEAGKRRMNEEVTPTVLKKTILKEAGTSPLPTPADTQLLGFTQKAEQFAAPSEKLSTPVTRGTVYELMRGVKDLLGPVLGSVPVLNKAMQPFASKGFQNWLSGNTKGMLRLQAAVDSRRGQDVMAVMAALRRTYAAEAGASENE